MKTALFEHHHLYYLPQFLPVMKELVSRGESKLFSSISHDVSDEDKSVFEEEMKALGIIVISGKSESHRRKLIRDNRFDIMFIGNNSHVEQLIDEHTFLVMVYHGIGLKESYYSDRFDRVNLRAVESEERYNKLLSLGETNLALTGFTKLDALETPTETDRIKWIEDKGLDPNKQTILYAPTFYPSSLEKTLPVIPFLAKNVNVMIKLHQFSWTKKKYTVHHHSAEKISNRVGVYLIPQKEYNILPYFPYVDGLITDISSTLFEFLSLDRPIIQTTYFTPRIHHRIFPWILQKRIDITRYSEVDFTHRVDSPQELNAMVKNTLGDPNDHSAIRLAARKRYLYRVDRQASARLVDAIEKEI